MENQGKLLEMLQGMKEVAAAQQNKLTKEEIKQYLGEVELSAEQMMAVYQYLGENHIEVEGYDYVPPQENEVEDETEKDTEETVKATADEIADGNGQAAENKKETVEDKEEKISRSKENMKLYQQEIARFTGNLQEEEELILSFLQGDDSAKEHIIEKYLQTVVQFAKRYDNRKVPEDEIIAEGNVGLMVGMQIIQENRSEFILSDGTLAADKFFGTLELEVTHAMECYIDEMTESKDWENTVLAKTNLLHEATKYMTEEMGRVPTIEELSEYTKISREEINSIRGLSEDTKRVAQER
ncbi:MAG: hypothetical protein SO170_00060 [Butyribacter sp.]|nr:hypothetical protein [bacterium]MDY3853348.1 hypothetical protein [Butyribacter sp.]